MDAYKAARRGWAILPDAVDEIPCLYQRHAGSLQPFLDFANLAGCMEPWIEGDLAAVRHLFGQPVAGFDLGPGNRGEMRQVHLRLDLRPVTSVDENPGNVRKNDTDRQTP